LRPSDHHSGGNRPLIFGHAVPMPVVVKTRTYDETFYRTMKPAASPTDPALDRQSVRVKPDVDLDFA